MKGFSHNPRNPRPTYPNLGFNMNAQMRNPFFARPSNITRLPEQVQHPQPTTAEGVPPSDIRLQVPDELNDNPKGCMTDDYEERVRPLIDLVDKFRRFGLDQDFGLPSIVVVGDQSAGKSSVLEAISGVQLPRGSGIVTRCPLELRLKRNKNVTWKGRIKYRNEEETIFSYDEVKTHVDKAQAVMAGGHKGISADLITLEIESTVLPDLTLVDLPGITRVAVAGQVANVEEVIKDMIKFYIQKPETIILAVTPANVDIATSEALKLAKDVDKDGRRTIGVITKTDLIDEGTEAEVQSILNNDRYELKKGFFAVRCRGQKAIDSDQSLSSALKEEDAFFKNSPYFRDHAQMGQCGIKALSAKLAEELVQHIQIVLPGLKAKIVEELHRTRDNVLGIGEGIPEDDSKKRQILMKYLNDYTDDLSKLADGHEDHIDTNIRLHNMARKEYQKFAAEIQKLVPRKRGKSTNEIYKGFIDQIQIAIDDDIGRELPNFIKFDTFKRLTWKIVEQFKVPSAECARTVTENVKERLYKLAKQKFQKFPKLELKIKNIISSVILERTALADEAISEMFEMESLFYSQAQTYTLSYESVSRDKGSSTQDSRRMGFDNPSVHIRMQAENMFTVIQAYMEICVLRIADIIPMIIMQHLVIRVAKNLREKVSALIDQKSGALETLEEDPDSIRTRQKLEAKLTRLEKAKKEMDRI